MNLNLKLILLILLTESKSQVIFRGRCPNIPPMKNFIPEKFLGRWYEIERFFVSYETIAGDCWVENYLFQQGRGFYTRLEWRDRVLKKILSIENGINFHKKEKARIRFVVQRPNIPFVNGEYLILDTDYETYALAWQCEDLPIKVGHSEILWLLSKYPHPPYNVIKRAKQIGASLGLSISKLQKQNRRNCNDYKSP